ncbi:DUF2798 domain-containing protein [Undibacterium sp. Jales W-56]|uniref:DUF2798 domain-containing protein n=1 Tax=Undibacterium sp. Jales W-56 TaxID=2897325 RepID=UPI0021D2E461|nr:DUF2798 domain-containing protein [Undibacterium sp. Jales W-56]MCU6434303.1 DUF2798 domain-containing protein [Undibacterium sp. Jales W-56]
MESAYTSDALPDYRKNRPVRAVAGSKSLASMLPTIVTTGVITLVATAVMRLLWLGFNNDFFGAWMEAWLTTWPIAFPIAYMLKPVVYRLSHGVSRDAATAAPAGKVKGLSLGDVTAASVHATRTAPLKLLQSPYIHR